MRNVNVSEKERLQDNTAGAGIGALVGGVAGLGIGKGYGKLAATAGGALLGGVGGALAQQALGQQQGIEYIVKLTNGQIMTVVQGPDNPMAVGQRVIVAVSHDGRSRVIPDSSPVQDVQPYVAAPTVIKQR
jgi:outer membrane lipoprotein SlyB